MLKFIFLFILSCLTQCFSHTLENEILDIFPKNKRQIYTNLFFINTQFIDKKYLVLNYKISKNMTKHKQNEILNKFLKRYCPKNELISFLKDGGKVELRYFLFEKLNFSVLIQKEVCHETNSNYKR